MCKNNLLLLFIPKKTHQQENSATVVLINIMFGILKVVPVWYPDIFNTFVLVFPGYILYDYELEEQIPNFCTKHTTIVGYFN